MMKFVFSLVALLHLCYSYDLNITLNREIIERLETLNTIYRVNKANITLPDPMRVPKPEMKTHGSSCVSVFVRELKHLLDNVTVHEASEHILQELQANLQELGRDQEVNHTKPCQMMNQTTRSLKPFNSYITFLRKLNNSKKR